MKKIDVQKLDLGQANAVLPLEADSTTLYFYKVVCKSRRVGVKNPKKRLGNFGVGFNSLRGCETQSCLDLKADLPWDRDVFYKTGLETIRTSRKPLMWVFHHTTKAPN